MDNYKKLKASQGLIVSLDEQLWKADQLFKDSDKEDKQRLAQKIVNEYFTAIQGLLNEKT